MNHSTIQIIFSIIVFIHVTGILFLVRQIRNKTANINAAKTSLTIRQLCVIVQYVLYFTAIALFIYIPMSNYHISGWNSGEGGQKLRINGYYYLFTLAAFLLTCLTSFQFDNNNNKRSPIIIGFLKSFALTLLTLLYIKYWGLDNFYPDLWGNSENSLYSLVAFIFILLTFLYFTTDFKIGKMKKRKFLLETIIPIILLVTSLTLTFVCYITLDYSYLYEHG